MMKFTETLHGQSADRLTKVSATKALLVVKKFLLTLSSSVFIFVNDNDYKFIYFTFMTWHFGAMDGEGKTTKAKATFFLTNSNSDSML